MLHHHPPPRHPPQPHPNSLENEALRHTQKHCHLERRSPPATEVERSAVAFKNIQSANRSQWPARNTPIDRSISKPIHPTSTVILSAGRLRRPKSKDPPENSRPFLRSLFIRCQRDRSPPWRTEWRNPRSHFHGFRWNTVSCSTAVASRNSPIIRCPSVTIASIPQAHLPNGGRAPCSSLSPLSSEATSSRSFSSRNRSVALPHLSRRFRKGPHPLQCSPLRKHRALRRRVDPLRVGMRTLRTHQPRKACALVPHP